MCIATGNRPFRGIFRESSDCRAHYVPKKPKIAQSCQRIRFEDNNRSITEFKVYQIKSAGIKRVKEYQSTAEAINVAAKCIRKYFEQRPKAGEHLISSSRFIERGRNYLKLSNHNYCTFNSHQNRTAVPEAQSLQQHRIWSPRATSSPVLIQLPPAQPKRFTCI